MTNRRTALVAVCLGLPAVAVQAQGGGDTPYPNRPIRIIVPWPAGGSVDAITRALSARLSAQLGQQVIVDNRAGASGNIGAAAGATAAPDGYTLLVATTPMVISASLQSGLRFNVATEFAAIGLITTVPNVLVVGPEGPASVKDLIAQAKAAPGRVRFASSGPGTQLHLVGESFKRAAGIDLVHVPYKGGPPALTDLLGGHVQMMFPGIPAVLPYLRARQLKPLAVTSRQRLRLLPEVPTMAEAGFPTVEAVDWYGIVAPAGTPKDIVARLNVEIVKALGAQDLHDELLAKGFLPATSTPEQFATLMESDRRKWATVIRQAGITSE
ncbi:MAG: tripartite tricarboxylate transporter substrate binding protein [Variovorax sp.]